MKAKAPVNGWIYWNTNAGQYGTDYEQRAMVTLIGPGLNFPQDPVLGLRQFLALANTGEAAWN